MLRHALQRAAPRHALQRSAPAAAALARRAYLSPPKQRWHGYDASQGVARTPMFNNDEALVKRFM